MGCLLLFPAVLSLLQNPRTIDLSSGWGFLTYAKVQQYLAILLSWILPPDSPYLTSVWSDSMIKRGRSALSARKVMLMAVVVVAPLCAAVPYVGASETLSFAWRVGLVVAIFSLVAVMCLSWLYTLPVVLAETFPIKNVASVMGICCGAGALGSVVFNQFVGSIPSEAWYTLFAIMGTLHIIAAVVLWKMVRPESPETK